MDCDSSGSLEHIVRLVSSAYILGTEHRETQGGRLCRLRTIEVPGLIPVGVPANSGAVWLY